MDPTWRQLLDKLGTLGIIEDQIAQDPDSNHNVEEKQAATTEADEGSGESHYASLESVQH